MKTENDIEYCLRREREERIAARAATDLAVHDVHFVMAERYADRAYSLSEQADAVPIAAPRPKLRVVL